MVSAVVLEILSIRPNCNDEVGYLHVRWKCLKKMTTLKKSSFFCKFVAFVGSRAHEDTMEASTNTLEFQNSEVARPNKRKGAVLKPRQHRPYKSVAGTSLESRVVELTKKIGVTESKMQGLRDKLKQHTDELALREAAPAPEVA